jgi:hypothetical protein
LANFKSSTLAGRCHCGGVTLKVPAAPSWVGDCNCSLCGRLGTLWAYYPDAEVEVTGETMAYVWGDRTIGIHHCPMCGCVSHWRTLGEDFGKMGVNARLLDGFDPCGVEVRPLDNR